MDSDAEKVLRDAIFDHLNQIVRDQGVVTREQLWDFKVNGEVHHLIDRNRGIRNPAYMQGTLSILSDPNGKYADKELSGALFAYAYREGSINGDNRKLRNAYELGLPIILFRKIADGVFVPVFPVYVVKDDLENRRFLIAVDDALRSISNPVDPKPLEKEYAERITKQRLHQPEFRGRVLRAYEVQCAVCSLRHGDLLDAAHIIADGKLNGTATVDNGLSLCKIHHAAYDSNFLGITSDYKVVINKELMEEEDGPMLRHGLQEMNNKRLFVPSRLKDQPSRERLAERFKEFQTAG